MEPLLALKKIFFTSSAIYISEDFVDIAEAKITFGGMKISSLQRIPFSKRLKDPSFSDMTDEIDNALSKIFPKDADKPIRIAINVENKYLILRRFSIRDIPRAELDQAIVFEAQKYIPSLIDNLTYGFKTYSRRPGLQEVVFAASETKNIHEITDYFGGMNILPSTIEPVPILLARSIDLKKNIKKDSACIFIHYEPANKVILCEISSRYPYFFRELSIAPDGDELEGQRGSAEITYPTLKSVWPRIEPDVIGGIDYLRKETNEKVEKIFISGFAPSDDEAMLSQEFGIPFERPDLSYFQGIEAEAKDRYLPALALLYDSQHKPFLNIAPQETVSADIWALKTVAVRSLAVLGIILIIHFFLAGIGVKKKAALEKAREGFAQYTDISRNAVKDDVTKYKNALVEKAVLINGFIEKKYYLSEKLSQLQEVFPPECWIDYLDYANKADDASSLSLTLKGFVLGGASATDINKILEAVKQNKKLMRGFKGAELVSVEKKELYKKEITEFEIILR